MLKKLLIITLFFTIILSSFFLLVFSESFYLKEAEKFNQNENKHVYQNVINYLKGNQPLTSFSEKEKAHMVDVKNLIQKAIYLFYISLAATLLLITYFLYKKRDITDSIIKSSAITIISLILFSVLIYFFFEKFFLYFHLILFDNNLWILNPQTDLLIQLFPSQFFIDFSKTLIIRSILFSLIIILITKYLKKQKLSLF